MTDEVQQYPGPRLVELLDGTLVFSDSEEAQHLRQARLIAEMGQGERDLHLLGIEQAFGVETANRLRKTIEEVIAVAAQRARQ